MTLKLFPLLGLSKKKKVYQNHKVPLAPSKMRKDTDVGTGSC